MLGVDVANKSYVVFGGEFAGPSRAHSQTGEKECGLPYWRFLGFSLMSGCDACIVDGERWQQFTGSSRA